MIRGLNEAAAVVFLAAALYDAGFAVMHGLPGGWALFIAPCVIYGVITFSQLVPVTSLNLTVKVSPENAPRIEPVAREFLATIKAYTMALITWVNQFAVFGLSKPLFFFIEAMLLLTIFATILMYLGKLRKLV